MMFLLCLLFVKITLIYGNPVEDHPQQQPQPTQIISERIVKTPWNVDKLSSDDIRCYCNLPICITTSYMCRTARSSSASGILGGCFSEIRDQNENPEMARHGCVELLPDDDQKIKCDNSPRKHNKNNSNKLNSLNKYETLMLCCQDDMCNHVDNQKRLRMNFTADNIDELNKPIGSAPIYPNLGYQQTSYDSDRISQITGSNTNSTNNNEFWFRVATILVPVLGAIILVILIVFAIRMLKNDSNFDSNSKLGSPCIGQRKIPIDFESNYNHAPLLKQQNTSVSSGGHPHIGNSGGGLGGGGGGVGGGGGTYQPHNICNNNPNSDKKNEHQAKINQLMHLEYSLLPQSCNEIKLTNTDVGCMYKNINLSLSQNRNRDTSDKVYEKEVLNPVTVNWAGSGGTSNSYGM